MKRSLRQFLPRFLRHARISPHATRRRFGGATARAIEAAIAASESRHRGELRFVAEGRLTTIQLWRGISARARAQQLFATLGVGETAGHSGILVYVLLAERRVEILADTGIAACVPQAAWDAICRGLEQAFAAGRYQPGALAAIDACTQLLAAHFPADPNDAFGNPDELPNAPLVL